jgi:hypothetical protein
MMYQNKREKRREQSEKGYTWFFFYVSPSWLSGLAITLLVIGISFTFYLWYSHYGSDPEASGNVGLSYALIGFAFVLLASTLYSLRRRVGYTHSLLNKALNWHVFFAFIALALLLMHSFGDFEASSGTYALAGLVALSVSGIIGRIFDRVLAWYMTVAVNKTLTVEGEDRLQVIAQEIENLTTLERQKMHGPSLQVPAPSLAERATTSVPAKGGNVSWDLAYISSPQSGKNFSSEELSTHLLRQGVPISKPQATYMSDGKERVTEMDEIEQALKLELRYRFLISSWRKLHIALALLTLVLILWHVITETPVLFIHLLPH